MALIGGSVSQLPEADMDMSKSVRDLSGMRFRKVNQLIVFVLYVFRIPNGFMIFLTNLSPTGFIFVYREKDRGSLFDPFGGQTLKQHTASINPQTPHVSPCLAQDFCTDIDDIDLLPRKKHILPHLLA